MFCRATFPLLMVMAPALASDEPSSYSELAPNVEAAQSHPNDARVIPLLAASANGASTSPEAIEPPATESSVHVVTAVSPAPPPTDTEVVTPAENGARRLRRSRPNLPDNPNQVGGEVPPGTAPLDFFSGDATTTALAATALVVGLFLVCAWTFKRSLPKSAQTLPREAVEILGRCHLGNKQFAHLLHVGNKVILVNVTATGAETLVEVDDPNEVTRILGACASSGKGSTAKEFDDIFQQFSKEPAPRGFLGNEASNYSSVASAYSQGSAGGSHG